MRTVLRSGLIDGEYYAAQRRWTRGGNLRAAADYVSRGFRAGLSPNPLFDELFAGRELPDLGLVPALYAYLVSDRVSVRVHPWWADEAYRARNAVVGGALEHAWRRPAASVTAEVSGRRRDLTVAEWRRIALDAVETDRLGTTGAMPVKIVRVLQSDDRHHDAKIRAAVQASGDAAVELVCVGIGASGWSSVAIAVSACAGGSPVSATRLSGHTAFAEVLSSVAGAADDGVVVMLDPRITPTAQQIGQLADRGRTAMVTPATLGADGTIAAVGAGVVGPASGRRLHRVLAGHPGEDLARLAGAELAVPLLTGRTFACPSSVLRRVATARPDDGFELEVLSARIRALDISTPLIVDSGVVVGCFDHERAFGSVPSLLPAALSAGGVDDESMEQLYRSAGFEVDSWRPESPTGAAAHLRRFDPRQRWAIKTSAPSGPAGDAWGDVHFARGLASALRRLGHDVVIDSRPAANRPTTYLDDVHLVIRGPFAIAPPPTGVRIEWIISHPDEITAAEVSAFDLVFAVSASWARRAGANWGLNIGHLLEATDTDLFRPGSAPRNGDLVFVGTARGIPRPSVVAPLAAGHDVKVYGPDWRGFIPPRSIVAPGIPNSELPALYGAAAAVLNDQWPAMRREGFIAMRPFDVVAAGGRVISESVEGLAEIFGAALAQYDTTEQLVELLDGDIDALFAPEDELARISARVRVEHSFDARAASLDAAVRKFAGTRPVD